MRLLRLVVRPAAAALTIACLTAIPAAGMGYRPRVRLDMENTGQGPLRFHAQTVCFRDDGRETRLEVSYAFSANRLQMLGDSGSKGGAFSFSVIVFDRDGRQAAGDLVERLVTADGAAAGRRHDRMVSGTVPLRLPPGQYRVAMACSDANSQRSARLEKKIIVPNLGRTPAISGLRFERASGSDTMPWPVRRYSDAVTPLIAYCELYPGAAPGGLASASLWSLDDEKNSWVSPPRPVTGEPAPFRIVIPADSLVSGNYELRAELADSSGRILATAAAAVIIDNPHRLTERDYQERIDQLRYIARSRELDSLRRSPDSLRDSLWQQFWNQRDPTPGTDRNEAMDEYFEKISQANQQFTIGIKPGWRTDRGQIYIRYGSPDEIERHPFETEVPAYEIWYYYRDGRKFIFSDDQGFGDYRLTYPRSERMQ